LRCARSCCPVASTDTFFGDPEISKIDAGGFTKDALSQAFRDAARKAGLVITFHDLRHVATTRLAPLHDNVLDLAATTGHKTLVEHVGTVIECHRLFADQ